MKIFFFSIFLLNFNFAYSAETLDCYLENSKTINAELSINEEDDTVNYSVTFIDKSNGTQDTEDLEAFMFYNQRESKKINIFGKKKKVEHFVEGIMSQYQDKKNHFPQYKGQIQVLRSTYERSKDNYKKEFYEITNPKGSYKLTCPLD